ncbi:MAG: GNAT family N-acetyltransferase [Rhodoferax sp.]|uniref:GNAT family N-acetyltransferase n=1 Tax=Rhodoferax sp. TaxID=50421 RepID=UPI003263B971
MQIRLAQAADFAQWLPLWKGYQTFYKTDIAESVTALTWQRFLDPAEPMHCAVAEIDGALVGMVHYIYHRSCWTAGDYVYLQDLFTLSNLRGKGVGRALIEHVYASAAHEAAARVWWLTHESNLDAMQLYDRIADKSGFVQYRKMIG